MSLPNVRRREFLRASLATGGGLLLGFHVPAFAKGRRGVAGPNGAEVFAPNAFVRIDEDGAVTVIINKAEMGQGVCTSLAMVLADELDAEWKSVGFEFAPAAPEYGDPIYSLQMVGGSTSVKHMFTPLRVAGATARAMLVTAAAKSWGVAEEDCATDGSVVVHRASRRRASYGELARLAAELDVPTDVPLKEASQFTRIGRSTPRLDTPDKSRGVAKFAIDIELPGMITAVVAHPPSFGDRAATISASAALAIPGVVDVFDVGSGVAVVAKSFWAAKLGRDALVVEWERGPNSKLSSEELHAEYRRLARTPGRVAREEGDGDAPLASAERQRCPVK